MSAQVGQAAQYFDSMGRGPFAATILATADTFDAARARFDQRPPEDGEVTLEVTRTGGRHEVKTYIPAEGSDRHEAAKAAIGEDETVCGAPKQARFWRAIA